MKKLYIKTLFILFLVFGIRTANGQLNNTITDKVLVSTSTCTSSPNPSFTFTNTGVGNVNFTSTSTGTTASSTYFWDFGDGNTSTLMNPTHTYTTNGGFLFKLVVTDGPCSDSLTGYVSISNLPCMFLSPAFLAWPASGGQTYFTSITGGTTTSTTYSWDFGDATYGYVNPIYHAYASNGSYTVWLVLTNPTTTAVCTATVGYLITVTNTPCSSSVNPSYTFTNTGGGNVNFTSTSTGTTAGTTYTWNFGDGNTSTGLNTAHTYSANGNWTVTLWLSNPTCVDSTFGTVPISGLTCSITPSFTNTGVSTSGQIYFTSTSIGVGPAATYYWDFGDATYGNTNPASHFYSSNGTYSVTLVVTDPSTISPCSATVTSVVTVTTPLCIVNPSFYLSKSTSTMTNLWFAYPTYPANITNAFWDWGDATSSTGLYPSHTYASTGWYNICLTVTVSCLNTGSLCVMSNIYRVQAGAEAAGIAQISVLAGQSLGINAPTVDNSNFNLYPNPNNGNFTIDISNINGTLKDLELNLFNVIGEKVYTSHLTPINGKVKSDLSLETLPNGTYFVKISGQNKTNKIIIMR